MAMSVKTFKFQLSTGTCTGSFWRPNPISGKAVIGDSSDWPRNGAHVRGKVHDVAGKGEWLEATALQQAGTKGWVSVEGAEKWLPFNGGSNGGQWLHAPEPGVE